VTPHTAFATEEALQNIADTTIFNIDQFLQGEELTNEVKPRK
jgi:lactate dehydrogenase-like 2-hydroxyacid dehydrogenase